MIENRTTEQIQYKLAVLKRLRQKCTDERRLPNDAEKAKMEVLLAEIDALESRQNMVNNWQDDPHMEIVRSGSNSYSPVVRGKHFKSPGEFFQSVIRAGLPGGQVDPRLYKTRAAGLNEAIPSEGGFLTEPEMSTDMFSFVWNNNQITRRFKRINLTGNATGIKLNARDETSRADGSRGGGTLAYWTAEAGEKQTSKPAFRQIELNLHKLTGLCYVTDELLGDVSALEQIVYQGFKDEFDFRVANAIINGTGAGQLLGILNSGAIISVGAESGQAADTIVYQNICKLWARLLPECYENAVFFINNNCYPQIQQMSLPVGTGGGPVFVPMGGASKSPYNLLFGKPLIPVEQCPVLGDTGDIILADMSKYVVAVKGGMQFDVSMHVRFVYDESCLRFVLRIDGAPLLASPVTPYTASATSATDTLSAWVKLDARN